MAMATIHLGMRFGWFTRCRRQEDPAHGSKQILRRRIGLDDAVGRCKANISRARRYPCCVFVAVFEIQHAAATVGYGPRPRLECGLDPKVSHGQR